ncbi:unnamed protein product [Prorocentrum cordatum]|uniref:Pre-mRNA-splicing factor 38 n=1 Tax=Prorocentrum cordatum TaxID=2364126 RepID=A0ABN9T308_9DINO|nr:unnamed protein product [Polarella glacialis]
MESEVTSRRNYNKPKREGKGPVEELVSTEPDHVLSMEPETRVDWLQMALMQAALGKLKAVALYDVIVLPAFAPGEGSALKPLTQHVLANLHLFTSKQKKTLEKAVASWASGGQPAAARAAERGRGGSERRGRSGSPSAGRSRSRTRQRRRSPRRRERSRSPKRRDRSRSAARASRSPSRRGSRSRARKDRRKS